MNKTHGRNGCPRLITSRSNPLIVSASSLSEKKYRDRTGCFAFEGIKLYKEAVASKVCLEHIFVREDVYDGFQTCYFWISLLLCRISFITKCLKKNLRKVYYV